MRNLLNINISENMQKIAALFLLAFPLGKLVAQEATEPNKLQTEIGIQANALFGRLVSNDGNGLVQNPYLLTGKLAFGSLAIRAGIGGAYNKEVQKEEGFANSFTILKQRLDLRLGGEFRFPLGPRWEGSFGFDAVGDWTQDKTINDSGFDVITDTRDIQYIGGGPVFGIKYQLSQHFSVATEGYVYYTLGKITDGEFFKNFPVGEDKIQKSATRDLQIGLPSALYLIFQF
jgi:hypothetical protein